MMKITGDFSNANKLAAAFGRATKAFRKEMAIVTAAGIKACKKDIAKRITEDLATSQREVQKVIEAPAKPTARNPRGIVRLKSQKRISLRHFGVRQTGAGVTYRVRKQGGRTFVQSGFMGPRPGVTAIKLRGNAFKRIGGYTVVNGKKKERIGRLKGITPYRVYLKNRMESKTKKIVQDAMRLETKRRLRKKWLTDAGVIGTGGKFSKAAYEALGD